MNITLINPPGLNMLGTQVAESVEEAAGCQPPLGLMYLASYLKTHSDHKVNIIDCLVERDTYSTLKQKIQQVKPDLVGITATTFTMPDVMMTAKLVKDIDPEIRVCVGGPHVDIYPEETIRQPDIDYAVVGEGETPLLSLADTLSKDGEMDAINGLLYKRAGEITMNRPNPPIKELDTLPFPARDLTPWREYYSIMTSNRPVTSMLTEKGCPYSCLFCYKHGGRRVRFRSPANVVDEMAHIKEMGIKEIFIIDETFNVNKKRIMDICDEKMKRGIDIPWGARLTINNADREMLEKFREAGCTRLHVGVEAGTEKILKVLRKNITLRQTRDFFGLCREIGITTLAYFVMGSPEETRADIMKTINFICSLDPDFMQVSTIIPYPATDLYAMAIEKGVFEKDYWAEFARNPTGNFTPRMWDKELDGKELNELQAYANKRFYTRPRFLWRQLRQVGSGNELKRKLRAGFHILFG